MATTTTTGNETTDKPGGGGGGDGRRPEPLTAELVIEGGQPVGGIQEIAVSKGDRVRIAVRSDTAGDVDVHGYEIEQPVKVGGVTTIEFTADIDGLFEMELHQSSGEHAHLAELTVNP